MKNSAYITLYIHPCLSAPTHILLEFTEVGMQEACGMALMIPLVQQLKGWIERTDRDALWDCLAFVVMMEGGVMHGWCLLRGWFR